MEKSKLNKILEMYDTEHKKFIHSKRKDVLKFRKTVIEKTIEIYNKKKESK